MKRTGKILLLGLLGVMALWGCEKEDQEERYHRYYLDGEQTKVMAESYEPEAADAKGLAAEFLDTLSVSPDEEGEPLLAEGVKVNSMELSDQVLNLDLNGAYLKMDPSREILARAGIVRTFTQITDISAVTITVNGAVLKNDDGTAVGRMTQETFVENSGKQINDYKYISMDLYFSDETGEKLKSENRALYYSSNVPLERVVVEQLIKGPQESGLLATIPPETKVLGVSVSDQICYVNLDGAFEQDLAQVQPETVVYSIVNTLTTVCDVKQVQISINGDTKVTFRDTLELDQFFEKNPKLMEES